MTANELLRELRHAEDRERDRIYRELVTLHTPAIRRIARRYRDKGEPEEDLRQVAMVGLLKAIRGFDPDYGTEFLSYALPMMSGEIKRHFRDHLWAIRVPRRYQEKRPEIHRTTALFEQSHGRSPTLTETAGLLEMSAEDTAALISASSAYSTLSLDTPYRTDEAGIPLSDTIGQADPLLESTADRVSLRPAFDALSRRDRRILVLRYLEERTQAQIAEQVGLSQMQVSRRIAAALKILRTQLTLEA